ncbi:MAG: trypsin-like serine protease [Planctomycetota bacterium]
MTRSRIAIGCVALFGLSIAAGRTAEAGIVRHDVSESDHTALAAGFSQVGRWSGGQTGGILIGADWVVTARHLGIGTGRTFSIGGADYQAVEVVNHPDFRGGGRLAEGGDLTLVRLANPVTGVTPIGYNARTDEVGRIAVATGRGSRGNGLDGVLTGGGPLLAGFNVLDATGDQIVDSGGNAWDERLLLADFDAPAGADPTGNEWDGLNNSLGPLGSDPAPLPLEFQLAGGDSGSGLFLDFGDGLGPTLAGVNSFVFAGSEDGRFDTYGAGFGVTRLSGYTDWIELTTGVAAINAAAVPEPTTCSLLGLAALTAVGRRRLGGRTRLDD